MNQATDTSAHFPFMILASMVLFFLIIRVVQNKQEFRGSLMKITYLSVLVVVVGMLFGKYGASFGLPWWIYYPVPMLITVFLPPISLKLNKSRTSVYLVLSFLSAPIIHALFSFLLDWHEYMPFWNIPYMGAL